MANLAGIVANIVEPKVKVANHHTPGKLIIEISGEGFASSRITLITNIGTPKKQEEEELSEYGFALMDVFGTQEIWSGSLSSLLDPSNGLKTSEAELVAFYSALYPLFVNIVKDLVAAEKITLRQMNRLE